jgi:hypothetical protein
MGRIMRRLLMLLAVVVALGIAVAAASADSCANLSRPGPNACPATGPCTRGNWVWLPSVGVPAPFWGFAPPGSEDAQLLGLPGAGGNHAGTSLLDMSAICRKGIVTRRQTDKGIQSGCE